MSRSEDTERRILDLFEAALDQPSPDRKAWLEAQTSDDPEVLQAVLALLSLDQQASTALKTGTAGEVASLPPPERIGAYRITRVIGEGGMGIVYEGERDRGDFEHRVAIKIVRPGLLSDKLIQRFSNERRILAGLTHAGIARLFDGGELEDGSPFFVMEYIEGQPITRWVEQQKLDEKETLRLFLDVLGAISYAHQNLIVHRDITPSNVMVTPQGQVKLIDFGIAKPQTEDADDERPTRGSLASLSFTPGFGAPERAEGAAPNILSDIYSLGRLLETILPTSDTRADLQAIIEKASAEKPADRYSSADQMSEDIDAYLGGYPVSANPAGPTKSLALYTGRHPIAVTLGSLAVLGLAAGLIIMSSLYASAQKARREADMRFNDLHALANTLMFDIADDIYALPAATTAKTRVAEASQTYLDKLASSENATDALKFDAAKGFRRLAEIQGSPSMSSLRDHEAAIGNLEKAETILIEQLQKAPSNEEVRLELGKLYFDMAHISINPNQDYEKAIGELDRSVEVLTDLPANQTLSFDLDLARISSEALRAYAYGWKGDTERAEADYRRLITEAKGLADSNPENLDVRKSLGSIQRNLGELLTRNNRFEEASVVMAEAVRDAEILLEQSPDDAQFERALAIAYWRHGFVLYNLGQHDASLAAYSKALEIMDRRVARDPADKDSLSFQGTIRGEIILPLIGLGRYEEAEEIALQSLAFQKSVFDEGPDISRNQRNMLVQHYQMLELYSTSGDETKACGALEEMWVYIDMLIADDALAPSDRESLATLNDSFAACGLRTL